MLAFYMDHQFNASVTRGLRARGIDVLTAFEDGAEQLDDDVLLTRATNQNRVLVTHDKGFLRIAAKRLKLGHDFTGIAFAVQKSLHIGNAIEYLELMSNVISPDEMRNRVERIPQRKN
jgi:hypothetical protein